MAPFSFPPPPPPPPPSASSNDQSHETMNNARDGRGSGRGGQNRGRGRGRGNDFRGGRGGGFNRGGYSHNPTNGSSNSNHSSNGYSTGGGGSYNTQTPVTAVSPNTQQYGYPYAPFAQQQAIQSPQGQQAALLNLAAALPQYNQLFSALGAMAQVQAQQGVQMLQYPSQNLPTAIPPMQYNAPPTNQHNFQNSYLNPPRNDFRNQYGGNKRKRDEFQSRHSSNSRHNDGTKPEVAPSVPSFGFSLPAAPPAASSETTNQQKKKKKKRTHNQLGLTPRGEDHESSEEEIDEEAAFAASGGALVFQHGRQTMALSSKAEVEAWIKERKAKYPTQARIAEKKRQETLKMVERQENRRKIREEEKQKEEQKSRDKNKRDKAFKAQEKADRLRAKLQKLEAKAARAAGGIDHLKKDKSQLDSPVLDSREGAKDTRATTAMPATTVPSKPSLGLAYESSAASDDDNSDISSSSEEPSSESSDSDSEGDSDSSDSDSAPETSTTTRQAPDKVAPPRRVHVPPGYCVKWVRGGNCPYGKKCRFKHEYPLNWKGPRRTMEHKVERKVERKAKHSAKPVEKKRVKLYDRLVQQELEAEDRMALQAIKDLGSRGLLG